MQSIKELEMSFRRVREKEISRDLLHQITPNPPQPITAGLDMLDSASILSPTATICFGSSLPSSATVPLHLLHPSIVAAATTLAYSPLITTSNHIFSPIKRHWNLVTPPFVALVFASFIIFH
ncbi:hypothetical protein PIB30_060878 [Stylosanthes scabra]|uniref:Uncharacterized protein n=1 Tax=Stylosanthes scabra TaxID=79078 RepID=A0ABU6QLD8_9FABA|nr:hypothetical protein [Stylosanthes scabra]